ncbi:MAG: cation diffusion facilitator family transporter [Candidatus Heimdallarchaeota archaeon]|nr:cation diffusion facilitator family transporter [Candidatus Heimdallarchaeota archaeon]
MAGSSLKAALLVNLTIGIMKMFVGLATASAAMVSEAYHSFADTFNQILLALGIRRSKQTPDLEHPFGYQKESFFWSFVVAVLIFGVSGLLALNKGIDKLGERPSEHDNDGFIWNIVVLSIAMVLEFYAFNTAYKEAKAYKELTNSDSILESLDEMQDPVLLSLLVEDSLALIGLSVALVGVTVTYITANPFYDGLTSIFIGVILIIGGLLLAKENKTYLIGKSVADKTKHHIDQIVKNHESVEKLVSRKTMLLGPKDMILTLDVLFVEGADEPAEIDKLEAALVKDIPYLTPAKIFIEAQDH